MEGIRQETITIRDRWLSTCKGVQVSQPKKEKNLNPGNSHFGRSMEPQSSKKKKKMTIEPTCCVRENSIGERLGVKRGLSGVKGVTLIREVNSHQKETSPMWGKKKKGGKFIKKFPFR